MHLFAHFWLTTLIHYVLSGWRTISTIGGFSKAKRGTESRHVGACYVSASFNPFIIYS